ncbi:MAG: acetyl-CoA hydrolase/transferase family protein [Ktedonobacteraceae bacterium]
MTTWCDAKTAVQVVKSGNRVYLHGRHSTPTPLIEALVARGEELKDVELLSTLSFGPVPYTDPRWAGHFYVRSIFVGASEREAISAGRASYAPAFLSTIPKLFMPGGPWAIDVALVQVSPPDKHGYCSLGPSVDATREAVDYARQVVALVNAQVPWAHGDSFVHLSQLDYAVNWDGPLHEVGQQAPNQMQREIGRHVADLIEDGATLQLGIGAIPDAVLQALTDRRDLGIHSEMFSDGVLDLVERGVITGARKALDRGKIVASFIIGSRRLMDFLDDNPMVELRSISYTNDIENIRQFDHMVAINSALEIDLTGQVCAESIGTTQYSGVGGQIDFLQGAADAPRGRPVLAFPATARAHQAREGNMPYELPSIDGQVSRIVPTLTPGAVVTTTRAHVHYVATEYGRVMLFGRSTADRARLLISIAAPQFREQLERAAYDLHLLYR